MFTIICQNGGVLGGNGDGLFRNQKTFSIEPIWANPRIVFCSVVYRWFIERTLVQLVDFPTNSQGISKWMNKTSPQEIKQENTRFISILLFKSLSLLWRYFLLNMTWSRYHILIHFRFYVYAFSWPESLPESKQLFFLWFNFRFI